jgi:hypothetical protein
MTDFSGSYDPQDVTFLLKVVELEPLEIQIRERLIQSGRNHYSELIGPEAPPDPRYLEIFHLALQRNLSRLARDFVKLAILIAHSRPGPLTLVSIARSGTPVGVIIGRILKKWARRQVKHYSISIIRDRGVDPNALKYILARHTASSVIFVDGWTGKGVIARELAKAIKVYNQQTGSRLDGALAVISDLAGVAGLAVSFDDYLIPSCLLNSVVSGLISRTILNDRLIGPTDFHGCLYYENLAAQDLSRWLVETVEERAAAELTNDPSLWEPRPWDPKIKALAAQTNQAFMANIKEEFDVQDDNLIKPGLGEATRVLLRRAPRALMVKSLHDPDVAHALALANQRGVTVLPRPESPYRAAAIIQKLNTGKLDRQT